MLTVVQYLRCAAAVLVLIHHSFVYWDELPTALAFGARGVDLFFVISGFVMAHSLSRHGATGAADDIDFAVRRALRIVPLYWIATLLIVRRDLFAGQVSPSLLMDLMFVPHLSAGYPGRFYPALVPGWSLNYEVFYYAILALAIAATRFPLRLASLVLASLALAGTACQPRDDSIFHFYTSPSLLLFVLGMGIRALPALPRRLPLALMPVLIGISLVAMCLPLTGSHTVVVGLPAACAVYVAVVWSERGAPSLSVPGFLGDASYAIYLFHGWGISAGRRALDELDIAPDTSAGETWACAMFLVLCGLMAGCIVHVVLERPLLRAAYRWWNRHRLAHQH